MCHTFGYQADQEQWCCSEKQDAEEAESSSKVSQCQPNANVCRYFYGSWYKTAEEGVWVKFRCVQRQTIVSSTDSKPGKTKQISNPRPLWHRLIHCLIIFSTANISMYKAKQAVETIVVTPPIYSVLVSKDMEPFKKVIFLFCYHHSFPEG